MTTTLAPAGPARPRATGHGATDPGSTPSPALRRTAYEPEPGAPPEPVPRATEPALPAARPTAAVDEPPGARAAIAGVLRLACEVLDGRRAEKHLARHVEPRVLRYWRAVAGRRHMRSPARFTRMQVCHPGHGVAEVALALHVDGRVRALAARFELGEGRWRCTELRLG